MCGESHPTCRANALPWRQSLERCEMDSPRGWRRFDARAPIVCSLVLVLQGCAGPVVPPSTAEPRLAPVLNEGAKYRIPDQYIVAFVPGTDRESVSAAQRTVRSLGGKPRFTSLSEPIWFSATMPVRAVEAMRATPDVAYIEADQRGVGSTVQPPNPADPPPAGLDRTSERLLALDNRFTYSEDGTGVHVYVLDTGIEASHAQFGGRAAGPHMNYIMDGGSADSDCHGHGTHVAGTIGGATHGIAKNVSLHSVRVSNCANVPPGSDVVASGVAWVTAQKMAMPATTPVVANMSLNFFDSETPPHTLSAEVAATIAAGVTVVISAGNFGDAAAGHWPGGNLSLMGAPGPIVVGAVDPMDDERWADSAFGSSVDLFAPGVDIESVQPDAVPSFCTAGSMVAGNKTQRCSGTSMAAAHVSGVAALYLDDINSLAKNPTSVKDRIIDVVADIFGTTPGWAGITNAGAGSPNKLLHWGSLDDGYSDGDPHIKTVNGVRYDFQGAGEYVALRDQDGMQIQTRQAAIATTFNPPPNPYTGLATCASLNTAVAARVGAHRVSYQPNISGVPDPSGLQLRVDGDLVDLGPAGIDLGSGGRIVKTAAGGIELHFPNETILAVTPGWWASQGKWYLNVDVLRTRSKEGLMGAIRPGSWLPPLPDGTSLGPMPVAPAERYAELYRKFGDAWRVTEQTSLFDYAPGTSTETFAARAWPPERPPCDIADTEPVRPATRQHAEQACREITDEHRRADCVFDVMVTGNRGFAETYRLSERIRAGSTVMTLTGDQASTKVGEWVTFTATVAPSVSANRHHVPPGLVQFSVDGSRMGEPVKLDSKGRARWETSRLKVGRHRVAASYLPGEDGVFLPSTSPEWVHTVRRCHCKEEDGSEKWRDGR